MIFTIVASRRAYQFAILELLGFIRKEFDETFKRISAHIIDQAEKIIESNQKLQQPGLTKVLNSAKLINRNYEKTPILMKKGLKIILKRLPLVSMISDLHVEISAGRKVDASTKLHSKIDTYLSEKLFGKNNTNWIYWLLPLNIALQWLTIKWMIG